MYKKKENGTFEEKEEDGDILTLNERSNEESTENFDVPGITGLAALNIEEGEGYAILTVIGLVAGLVILRRSLLKRR